MLKKDIPKPISKRQHMYVTSKADVTLFGGAAGSGKSEIGVIDFLQYVGYKNFIGVITRRTTVQLKGAGGILTKCMRTFSKVFEYGEEFVWKEKDNKFVFYDIKTDQTGKKKKTARSEIYLKHFEHEKNSEADWQGTEANLYLVDEGTQFTIGMINYIMSRMRNPSCVEVEPKLKITCNPDADHPLREWVEPYLNEDGTPDRNKDGLIRYFTAHEGEYCWGDSVEEVVSKSGCEVKDVLSFTFVSANVYDNRIVQEINPKYVAWLKGLKGVNKHRLLYGNWKVRESTSTYFQRQWVTELTDIDYSQIDKVVRAWDLADKLPSDANPSPDYTISAKMARMKNGEYILLDLTRHRVRTGEWLSHILDIAEKDGQGVDILLPQDPNPSAKIGIQQVLLRPLNERGYYAICKSTNQKKLDRFRPFSAACQNESIFFLKNCGNDFWNKNYNTNDFIYKELEAFTGERKRGEAGHDDIPDACSDAFMYLATKFILNPSFLQTLKATDLSCPNPLLNIQRGS